MPDPEPGLTMLKPLVAVHRFRPAYLALKKLGLAVECDFPVQEASTAVLTLPRQLEWACGLLGEALVRLPEGATLIASAHNTSGGRRYAALLEEHFELAWSDSKNHCRSVALKRPAKLPPVVEDWRKAYRPHPVDGTGMKALPGVFSWEHVDAGSALLASCLPALTGRVADFGAGFGYLAAQVLAKGAAPVSVDLFEADLNALEMAKQNLAGETRARFFWHDLPGEPCPEKYDAVIMNPPFHETRTADPALGLGFIRAAAAALKPGGALWLVANRQLPYEQALAEQFSSHESVAAEGGFKVLSARK
jgi:16S rRNA (guanine1207-N2)-methyltransferase